MDNRLTEDSAREPERREINTIPPAQAHEPGEGMPTGTSIEDRYRDKGGRECIPEFARQKEQEQEAQRGESSTRTA